MISWQATDISGINSSWCTIDANDYSASGTYYVIVGPYSVGNYDFTISAADGDISPETSEYSYDFRVITCDFRKDNEGKVNFKDFAILASPWKETDCNISNGWCEGVDLDSSGDVDYLDIRTFAQHWLDSATH